MGPVVAACASAPAASKVAVGPLGTLLGTSSEAYRSVDTVRDAPTIRPRRADAGGGAAVSSGVTRLNYPVPAGAIIIASTRESGVPG